MSKPAHNLMAYNSQIAVDDKYKFIVATDISTKGSDLDQLHNMAVKSKEIVDNKDMIVTADKGYYSSVEIKKCADDNINVIVPERNTGQVQKNRDKFSKNMFIFNHKTNSYTCPNQITIPKSITTLKRDNRLLYVYRVSQTICKICPMQDRCLGDKTKYKQLFRWEYEEIVEEHHKKMQTKKAKDIVKKRGSKVANSGCAANFL